MSGGLGWTAMPRPLCDEHSVDNTRRVSPSHTAVGCISNLPPPLPTAAEQNQSLEEQQPRREQQRHAQQHTRQRLQQRLYIRIARASGDDEGGKRHRHCRPIASRRRWGDTTCACVGGYAASVGRDEENWAIRITSQVHGGLVSQDTPLLASCTPPPPPFMYGRGEIIVGQKA